MKNLSNCTPTEFLSQTVKIKRSAEKWLKATDVVSIRRNMPKLEQPTLDMDVEAKAELIAENKRKMNEQALRNVSQIIDKACEEYPEETLELLALVCFVEPKDVDKHSMSEYLTAVTEMITDDAVVNFFISLQRLGLMNT